MQKHKISKTLNKELALPNLNYLVSTKASKLRKKEVEFQIEQIEKRQYQSKVPQYRVQLLLSSSTKPLNKKRKQLMRLQQEELEEFQLRYKDEETAGVFI